MPCPFPETNTVEVAPKEATCIKLRNHLCPGDILVMTAAVESLKQTYPNRYRIAVETSCPAIWQSNPHVEELATVGRVIDLGYPLINKADHWPVHFMQGFVDDLATQLGVPLTCKVKRPYLYLSDEERSWMNQVEQDTGYRGKFWLINAGYKNDYQIKKWRLDYWQEVVDKLHGKITFVQVGEKHHNHTPLRNVIDFIGKTDLRQLIRLGFHAQGAITAESFHHHLMAAFCKPCVTLCSGFLPVRWIAYHTGTVLTYQQNMTCCSEGKGCWRSRVIKLNDGDGKDSSLCMLPVFGSDPVAKCMNLITPEQVVKSVLAYYDSGMLSF